MVRILYLNLNLKAGNKIYSFINIESWNNQMVTVLELSFWGGALIEDEHNSLLSCYFDNSTYRNDSITTNMVVRLITLINSIG